MFPHAAITAAALAAKRAREEEQVTTYNQNDLNGWEFKIVRSNFGRFSSLDAVQKICREEAETGWELVEKFDSYRLRFKRRIEHRSRDNSARLDPYRTSPGFGNTGGTVALVLGLLLVALGIGAFLFLSTNHGGWKEEYTLPLVLAVLILIPVVMLVLKRAQR